MTEAQVLSSPERPGLDSGSVLPLPDETGSGGSTVLAYGVAAVHGGDLASARRTALQAAYAEAVALGSGLSIGTLTVVRNVKQVTDVVLSKARGIITGYDIVGEEINERDGLLELRIGIEATVVEESATEEDSTAALRLFLGVLGEPRVMVLVSHFDATMPVATSLSTVFSEDGKVRARFEHEVVPPAADYAGTPRAVGLSESALQATEAAIAAKLNGFGYRTFTSDSIRSAGAGGVALVRAARAGDAGAALAVAREAGAAALVVGNLVVAHRRITPQGVEFEQATGELSAKAYIVSTKREVQTFHVVATRAHTNLLAAVAAIRDAVGASLSEELAWTIPSILADSPHVLQVELQGVEFERALRAASSLETLEGVIKASLTSLPDKEGRSAVIEVETGFLPVERALFLKRLESELGAQLDVERSTPYDLRVSLAPSSRRGPTSDRSERLE